MIETAVTFMQSIIAQYGAWGVFGATMLEEIIAPIPSPIVPLAAGFFLLPLSSSLTLAVMKAITLIALPVSLGVSLGSSIMYAIGYFGGKPFVEQTRRWSGIDWHDVERTEARLTSGRGDEITLFVLRLLPIIPGVAISGLSGIIRYPYKKFIAITAVGSFLRAFALGLIGWQAGELYVTYASTIAHFEKIGLAVVLLVLICAASAYVLQYYRRPPQIVS